MELLNACVDTIDPASRALYNMQFKLSEMGVHRNSVYEEIAMPSDHECGHVDGGSMATTTNKLEFLHHYVAYPESYLDQWIDNIVFYLDLVCTWKQVKKVHFFLVLMELMIQLHLKRRLLTLSRTMYSGVMSLYQHFQLESLELIAFGNLLLQGQGGMVLHEMMWTVVVDGKEESDNLTPILILAFHGLMQKLHHFFAKVAHASMPQDKAAAYLMIGSYNMLHQELHLIFLKQ
jgi:hypothetical protein